MPRSKSTDHVDRATRSRIMAAVKSRGTRSTERRLMSALSRARISGWIAQARDLPGTPDIAFEKNRVAIFVDGCFWHGCFKCYRRPKSSQAYWDDKLKRNSTRDRKNRAGLRRNGWSVVRFWEHEVSSSLALCVEKIRGEIWQK